MRICAISCFEFECNPLSLVRKYADLVGFQPVFASSTLSDLSYHSDFSDGCCHYNDDTENKDENGRRGERAEVAIDEAAVHGLAEVVSEIIMNDIARTYIENAVLGSDYVIDDVDFAVESAIGYTQRMTSKAAVVGALERYIRGNDELCIDGFVQFRLRWVMAIWDRGVEWAIEESVLRRERFELILLLAELLEGVSEMAEVCELREVTEVAEISELSEVAESCETAETSELSELSESFELSGNSGLLGDFRVLGESEVSKIAERSELVGTAETAESIKASELSESSDLSELSDLSEASELAGNSEVLGNFRALGESEVSKATELSELFGTSDLSESSELYGKSGLLGDFRVLGESEMLKMTELSELVGATETAELTKASELSEPSGTSELYELSELLGMAEMAEFVELSGARLGRECVITCHSGGGFSVIDARSNRIEYPPGGGGDVIELLLSQMPDFVVVIDASLGAAEWFVAFVALLFGEVWLVRG